jgi:ABC-type sugar transport system, periplasmic component
MKIKKPSKLILIILLAALLIALTVVLVLFVRQATSPLQPQGSAAAATASHEAPKNIVYIANNLASQDEYETVMLIKKSFEDNGNINLKILDPNGMLPIQLDFIRSLQSSPPDLLILSPIDKQNISGRIGKVQFPVIYMGIGQDTDGGSSIGFSDDFTAQLIAQHYSSIVSPGSSICVVGTEQSDSLYQATLKALQQESKAYGTSEKIYSYFTNDIVVTKLKMQMPNLLQSQSVIVLNPLNLSSILQYLNQNTFSGDITAVSQDEKMLSRILDGSLNAIVYRDKAIQAKTVFQNAISDLSGKPVSSRIECGQELLNIHNINDYLESVKNSTY